ncbi:MAG: fused MFS/spermidine synthase [Kiritimatiellae bacterium]|nr:fused MFS/spermidine synthase [Kiritimatiellia bacterium]
MTFRRLPALVVFSGSLLLFVVQPMLGRTLLPSFGGTAAVWTVCLAAYQTLLLAGYFYAHLVARRTPRRQCVLHLSMLALGVLWAVTFAALRPVLKTGIGNSGAPAFEVLLCVLAFIGLPYVLLSANSTLIQSWLAHSIYGQESGTGSPDQDGVHNASRRGRDIYRLYAISNLGSFVGLLVYPFLLEPCVSLTAQWWAFAACLAGYTMLVAFLGRRICEMRAVETEPPPPVRSPLVTQRDFAFADRAPIAHAMLWWILPAVSVFQLNAITTHLTQDVMPLPLLWVVLLGLFLLSYVLGFSGLAGSHLGGWCAATILFVGAAGVAEDKGGSLIHFGMNLLAGGGLCLVGGTFLHGRLYALRPAHGQLTQYYLYGAAGGAVGGLLASLVAPMVFRRVTEYPVAMGLTLLIAMLHIVTQWRTGQKRWAWAGAVAAVIAFAALIWAAVSVADTKGRTIICRMRGFHGLVTVTEMPASVGHGATKGIVREFVHGGTVHGMQALIPGKERMPTTYYTETGGGFAIVNHANYRTGRPLRVGLVGCGIGVMLAYCRTNDFYRCFEISPEVAAVATNPALFTFFSGAPGKVELVLGDARKELEKELARQDEPYDVLIVDAFTGDNQPYHIFTREAFATYFKRLKPDGLLAVNISNWHLELMPFAKSVSGAFDVSVLGLSADKNLDRLAFGSLYAVYCREPGDIAIPAGVRLVDFTDIPDVVMPTDEKGSFNRYVTW